MGTGQEVPEVRVERGGASLTRPGDRKCLLPVASCQFPASHFSICLPPTGSHLSLTQELRPIRGWSHHPKGPVTSGENADNTEKLQPRGERSVLLL